jgi:hypothetical protein
MRLCCPITGTNSSLRLLFAYTVPVWYLLETRLCDYTLRSKGCSENIPAPVLTMPDTWIIAECTLCGERRSYLPTDIFRGRLSHRFIPSREPPKSESRSL